MRNLRSGNAVLEGKRYHWTSPDADYLKEAQKFDEACKHYLEVAKRMQKREILKSDVLNKAKELFRQGHSTNLTAKIIGIPRSTLRYWLNKKRE